LGGKTNPIPLSTFPLGTPGLREAAKKCTVSLLEFARPIVPPKYRNTAIYLLLQLADSRARLGLHLHLLRRILLSLVTLKALVTCRLMKDAMEKNNVS